MLEKGFKFEIRQLCFVHFFFIIACARLVAGLRPIPSAHKAAASSIPGMPVLR